jgi:hypothetical protein
MFVDSIVNVDPKERGKAWNMLLRGMVEGPKSPKSLQAYLHVIVDDLLTWNSSQPVRDYTRGPTGPVFQCRVRVLAVIGDFPAQAKVCNHVGVGGNCNCPFCLVQAVSSVEMQGTSASVFPLSAGKEARRTHAGMVADMDLSDRLGRLGLRKKAKSNAKETGTKGLCAYRRLSYVRFPWFRTVDWMHLLAGLLGRHIFPLLSGDRTPGALKSPREKNGWDEKFGKLCAPC